MMYTSFRNVVLGACAAFAITASPAFAEDAAKSAKPFDIELTIAGVSDYRFRGISLSDKDPAFQPQLAVTHESGIYGRVWASNIAANAGDDIEVDLVAGFARDIGAVSLDLGATYYLYPGASGLNYVEFIGAASTAVGQGSVGVTVAYVPSQSNTGSTDNIYLAINGSLPIGDTPFSLTSSFGFEDGAFGTNKKDWSVGLTADVVGFTLGVSYVDTARARAIGRLSKAGVVFSASRSF